MNRPDINSAGGLRPQKGVKWIENQGFLTVLPLV